MGKATFADLLGLDGARARAEELVAEAIASLAPYGDRAQNLADAARFIVSRRRFRRPGGRAGHRRRRPQAGRPRFS